ncbi:MAG: hypothetical protein HY360_10185 [Verrucomicrobia bacterium]|nr:hypothetical protein [Verrucomicrobiota bacterium]
MGNGYRSGRQLARPTLRMNCEPLTLNGELHNGDVYGVFCRPRKEFFIAFPWQKIAIAWSRHPIWKKQ